MQVLAVYNLKGGVGKTTTAVNLAYLAARGGTRTLVWDLDPQGAASYYFRVKPKVRGGVRGLLRGKLGLARHVRATHYEWLDLLPSDITHRHLDLLLRRTRKPKRKLRRLLRSVRDAYDYVFMDCAPSISLTSESIFVASDALLVPTVPTALSLRALEQLREHVASMNRNRPRILPFFSMVDLRKSLHRETCDRGAEDGAGFLRTRVPYSSTIERGSLRRAPLEAIAPRSGAADVYRLLWDEVVKCLADRKG